MFLDDNPAEREIVLSNNPDIAVPDIEKIEKFIFTIDQAGYFEVTNFSEDDKNRNEMYKKNLQRSKMKQKYDNYNDYLLALNMKAEIKEFDPIYISRIAQLTNKVNQFNLTTKRYSQSEIEDIYNEKSFITLYGKLEDKFGDNGVTTVVIGRKDGQSLHIDLWIMSCRIIKRDMEKAMMDILVKKASKFGIDKIFGYYSKTAKNDMVKNHYKNMFFTLIECNGENSVWELKLKDYQNLNHVIKIKKIKNLNIFNRIEMERNEILKKVNEIFCDVFDDDTIVISDDTTANDIDDWDSLMQIELITEHEAFFGLKFGMKEVLNMKNVGEMIDIILKEKKMNSYLYEQISFGNERTIRQTYYRRIVN